MRELREGFRERPAARYGVSGLWLGLGMGPALTWEILAARH